MIYTDAESSDEESDVQLDSNLQSKLYGMKSNCCLLFISYDSYINVVHAVNEYP
jgi:hypothetical protein